jgi:hypothetical protein
MSRFCILSEIVFRLVLLNKLLEDGNTLYRKGRLKEAAYRYIYALNKFPAENELDSTFKQLQINFYLNTSRCKRKLNVNKLLQTFQLYLLQFNYEINGVLAGSQRVYRVRGKSAEAKTVIV